MSTASTSCESLVIALNDRFVLLKENTIIFLTVQVTFPCLLACFNDLELYIAHMYKRMWRNGKLWPIMCYLLSPTFPHLPFILKHFLDFLFIANQTHRWQPQQLIWCGTSTQGYTYVCIYIARGRILVSINRRDNRCDWESYIASGCNWLFFALSYLIIFLLISLYYILFIKIYFI